MHIGIIVGDGFQKKRIAEQIKSYDLEENVIMPGTCPYDKVPLWFQASDIGVVTLTKNKIIQQNGSYCMKLWEYLSTGLPTIVTDIKGTDSYSLLSSKSVVVPPEQPIKMYRSLIKLIKNRELGISISNEGKRYVDRYKSWKKAAEETVNHLEGWL